MLNVPNDLVKIELLSTLAKLAEVLQGKLRGSLKKTSKPPSDTILFKLTK